MQGAAITYLKLLCENQGLRGSERTMATPVNRAERLELIVDRYSTLESPVDSSAHVIAQFLRSLQRSLDPNNLHLAGRDLSSRFAVTSRSHQAALMAGQHSTKNRNSTFLWLRLRTAKTNQSLRAPRE